MYNIGDTCIITQNYCLEIAFESTDEDAEKNCQNSPT